MTCPTFLGSIKHCFLSGIYIGLSFIRSNEIRTRKSPLWNKLIVLSFMSLMWFPFRIFFISPTKTPLNQKKNVPTYNIKLHWKTESSIECSIPLSSHQHRQDHKQWKRDLEEVIPYTYTYTYSDILSASEGQNGHLLLSHSTQQIWDNVYHCEYSGIEQHRNASHIWRMYTWLKTHKQCRSGGGCRSLAALPLLLDMLAHEDPRIPSLPIIKTQHISLILIIIKNSPKKPVCLYPV